VLTFLCNLVSLSDATLGYVYQSLEKLPAAYHPYAALSFIVIISAVTAHSSYFAIPTSKDF
jgi:hypothetical protein